MLLGAVAAKLQAPALTGGTAVTVDGNELTVRRSVYGGIAEDTVTVRRTRRAGAGRRVVPAGTGVRVLSNRLRPCHSR